MQKQITRESESLQGFQLITVLQFASGEVEMQVDDIRCYIQEIIALREYVDAHEITYDFEQGWMANGKEIPYLDNF